jgi:hypothetical protein
MSWFKNKIDAVAILKDTYERQIALLQEQLADARADAQRHCDRADHAVDYLVNPVGLQAISAVGKREAAETTQRVVEHMEKTSRVDLFDDCSFEDGTGAYKSREEAALTNG